MISNATQWLRSRLFPREEDVQQRIAAAVAPFERDREFYRKWGDMIARWHARMNRDVILQQHANLVKKRQLRGLRRELRSRRTAPIFTLAGFTADGHTHRTFGFYHTEREAQTAVARNAGDMEEGLYEYLVLECSHPGTFAIAETIRWYRWAEDRWQESPAPEWAVATVNFSMG